jgi:sec-independent protein translocase protein TatC
LSVDEFIYYVIGLTSAVGVMFLMPLFMIMLSATGIIEPNFWAKKWQVACLTFLIASALITPDGTGITMMLLFAPLAVLYAGGYYFSRKIILHDMRGEKVELQT